jgi:hypothetical protein
MIAASLLHSLLSFWLIGPAAAQAASPVSGSEALAVAAIVAEKSPLVDAQDKKMITALFAGELKSPVPTGKKITVEADSIVCKAGNVDIAFHACDLTFGKNQVTLNGRSAHELFATLVAMGIEPDAAAGTAYAGVSRLKCTIDVSEVQQNGGGGASCAFDSGSP